MNHASQPKPIPMNDLLRRDNVIRHQPPPDALTQLAARARANFMIDFAEVHQHPTLARIELPWLHSVERERRSPSGLRHSGECGHTADARTAGGVADATAATARTAELVRPRVSPENPATQPIRADNPPQEGHQTISAWVHLQQ